MTVRQRLGTAIQINFHEPREAWALSPFLCHHLVMATKAKNNWGVHYQIKSWILALHKWFIRRFCWHWRSPETISQSRWSHLKSTRCWNLQSHSPRLLPMPLPPDQAVSSVKTWCNSISSIYLCVWYSLLQIHSHIFMIIYSNIKRWMKMIQIYDIYIYIHIVHIYMCNYIYTYIHTYITIVTVCVSNPIDLQHIQLPPPPAPGAPPELPSRRAGSGLLSSWQDCSMVKDPGLGINLGIAWYSTLPNETEKLKTWWNIWKIMDMYGMWRKSHKISSIPSWKRFSIFFGVAINHGNLGQIIPHISHIQAIPIYGRILFRAGG